MINRINYANQVSLCFAVLLFLNHPIEAQDLSVGYDMFLHKKPAYITNKDGTTIEGTVDKIKRKKGLFDLVIIEVRNKKIELKPNLLRKHEKPDWEDFAKHVFIIQENCQ